MEKPYSPPSAFLKAVIREEVKFGPCDLGEQNLTRLIATTQDPDPVNRDWATLLLALLELDRPDVRTALAIAAIDEHPVVRAEAILGIAQLDRAAAFPLVKKELEGDAVCIPLIEAAIIVADASLISDLEAFSEPSDNEMLDEMIAEAIRACGSTSQ